MILHVFVVGELAPEAWRLIRLDRRPADPVDQEPAQEEGLIADHFGCQPQPGTACQEAVFRVARENLRREPRRLPIGRARDHQPEHGLRVPTGPGKLRRQPVEELGVARRLTLRAEVVDGLDQSRAEEHLPVAVDRHPGRQRIAAVDQPPGQAKAVGIRSVRPRRKPSDRAWPHLLSRFIVLSPNEQVRRARSRQFLHHHGCGNLIEERLDISAACGFAPRALAPALAPRPPESTGGLFAPGRECARTEGSR